MMTAVIIGLISMVSILGLLAIRSSFYSWLLFLAIIIISLQSTNILSNGISLILWMVVTMGAIVSINSIRQKIISAKILNFIASKLLIKDYDIPINNKIHPEADLFRGSLNADQLLNMTHAELTNQELMFLNHNVAVLCQMLNDWKITQDKLKLPVKVLEYLQQQKFFAMNIPIELGGLGFSTHAIFEIIQKIATRNITAAVVVMVPNTVNIVKLLLNYGTKSQITEYAPKIAQGEFIPSVLLVSDDTNVNNPDHINNGIVCYQKHQNQEVLGVCLNWQESNFALAPIANLIVLSINLYDPHNFLCLNKKNLGKNICLVSTDLPNITNNTKSSNTNQDFLNGSIAGKNVFVPLNCVVGAKDLIGQNWHSMMDALGRNQNITCLALTFAISKLCFKNIAHAEQATHNPEHKIKLAKIAGYNYMLDAMREFVLTPGIMPVVAVTMFKEYINEIGKEVTHAAMEIYGSNITFGIKKHLAVSYQNILISSNIDLFQLVNTYHPFLYAELEAVKTQDLELFDHLIGSHLSYAASNFAKICLHIVTNKIFFKNLNKNLNNNFNNYFKNLKFFSIMFAGLIELSLLMFNNLSHNNKLLSKRLWDIFRHLCMGVAIIKYYNKHNNNSSETFFADWSLKICLYNIQHDISNLAHNFPNKFLGKLINFIFVKCSKKYKLPTDDLEHAISEAIIQNSDPKNRLLVNCYMEGIK